MIGYWAGSTNLGQGLVDEIQVNINGTITAQLAESATPFVICTFGVIIGGIIALIVGVLGSRGNFRKRITLISGILMIAFMLLFMFWINSSYETITYPILVYEDPYGSLPLSGYTMGFGLIGPFIGGAFCLAGGLIRT